MSYRVVTTWPEADLLPELRAALDQADEALLCVAFANLKGVNLVEPQLRRLGRRARLVMTTTFSDSSPALARVVECGVRVRVLNLGGGTYHPKMYLTASGATAQVLIGSANLTSGLVCNIEVGTVLSGARSDPPLLRAWDLGERLWVHPTAVDWEPGLATPRVEPLGSALSQSLAAALPAGSTVMTLARGRPNIIREVAPEGVYIETIESIRKERPAQLVPAWMIELAWEYLRAHGHLTNNFLLNELNVKRSSAVMAVLSRMPDIEVASVRPLALRLRGIQGLLEQ